MTLIASALQLGVKEIKRFGMTDAYSLHRVVYSLFNDVRDEQAKVNGASSGILYAERGEEAGKRLVVMLSNRPPRQDIDGYAVNLQTKLLPTDFLEHARYRFRVVVNPVRRSGATRLVMPVKGRDEVLNWFADRASGWGFEVVREQIQMDSLSITRFQDKNKNNVTLAQATISGSLQVTNQQKFSNSFKEGIGRGRAFGCGLLQIVPIIDSPFA